MQMVADIHSGKTMLDIEGICRQVLKGDKLAEILRIPNLNNIGTRVSAVADMGAQRQKHLRRLCEALVNGVLQMAKDGEADPAGTMKLIFGGDVVDTFTKQSAGLHQVEHTLNHPLFRQVGSSYCDAIRHGHRNEATQLMSLVTAALKDMPGVTQKHVEVAFTSMEQLSVGQEVKVIVGSSRQYRQGSISSIQEFGSEDTLYSVKLEPKAGASSSDDGGEPEGELLVRRSELRAAMDVVVTRHAMTKASLHSKTALYAGDNV